MKISNEYWGCVGQNVIYVIGKVPVIKQCRYVLDID